MRIIASLAVLFCFTLTATAQKPYFSYTTIQNGDGLSFPVFSQDTNSRAVYKINSMLQLCELSYIIKNHKENIFQQLINVDTTYTIAKSVDVNTNTPNILSVTSNSSFCKEKCFKYRQYYNFYSRNGDILSLYDLMTEEGYGLFREEVNKQWAKKVNAQRTSKSPEQTRQFDSLIKRLHSVYQPMFCIKNDSLFIDGYNCLTKDERLAEINTIIGFSIKKIQKYLSPRGMGVLGLENDGTHWLAQSMPQVFEGKVGNETVIMVFNGAGPPVENGSVSARYAYLKNGIGILLEGDVDFEKLTLKEIDFNENVIATINGKYKDERITATRVDTNGIKSQVSVKRKF